MKIYFRIIFGLLIIWIGVVTIRQTMGGYELGLFHQLQYIPFILLIISTLLALLLDMSFYKLDKKPHQYITSLIGLVLCAIAIFKIVQRNLVDNSKTVLEVSNLPDARNVLTFEFKANNTFRVTEFNLLGQIAYYGKYDKIKDTIFIRDNNYDGYAKELPKTGVIKFDTVFWTKFDTMLVEMK